MKTIRVVLIITSTYLFICFGLPYGPHSSGQEPEKTRPKDDFIEVTPELRTTVTKGLDYLATHQSRRGSYGQHYQVAVTSLAGLAFLAGGNLPGEGKYGDNVKNALRYILSCATKMGYITEPGSPHSRMHGHGFATWFLAEIYGMSHNNMAVDQDKIKLVLKKAIKIIENSQSAQGGWTYQPIRSSDEGSVTICIVQALRAARNVGIAVDKNVIDKGVDYLKRSANPDGSFKYSVGSGSHGGTFALAAGGTSSLCLYGKYDLSETKKGLEFLMRFKPGTKKNWQSYPFYQNFYATLAMYLAGDKYWAEWFPPLRDHLIKIQQPDGTWSGGADRGAPDYGTAFACLTLQIPYQYLPLFQR